jgi:hypothetical protein
MYLVASNNCGNDTAFLDLASVGIEEISISEMGIYPNPSSGLINIDVKSKIRQTISITVVDLSGRKVNGQLKNVQVGSSMLSVDCSSLYSGIYLLHLQSRSGSLSTRLIIQ